MSETNQTCEECGCPMLGCPDCGQLYCPDCLGAEAIRQSEHLLDEALLEMAALPGLDLEPLPGPEEIPW